ncbi:hypothetical protein AAFF_G00250980 [Aldrovandia affinis]|uniref:Uncharacterized protein n=1 Tax=Aldrovandia affinis TaxID=143900 RepID=A0AAD7RCP2_9TELE|nr:hypothetical protein AAFF_G00250980 [Aldrovandia affinis]
MVTEKSGSRSRLCPSARILQLAQHKRSKTEWVTTPWKVTWGNQELIRPLAYSALCAIPTERTLRLAKHKRLFSVWDEQPSRKAEEGSCSGQSVRPASWTVPYEDLVRLSTPKHGYGSSREVRPPHTAWCDHSCPIWHFDTKAPATTLSPRLVQLAGPKGTHPNFRSNRESVQTRVSDAAKSARSTPRLDLLSLPKMRESSVCVQLGSPEEPSFPMCQTGQRVSSDQEPGDSQGRCRGLHPAARAGVVPATGLKDGHGGILSRGGPLGLEEPRREAGLKGEELAVAVDGMWSPWRERRGGAAPGFKVTQYPAGV